MPGSAGCHVVLFAFLQETRHWLRSVTVCVLAVAALFADSEMLGCHVELNAAHAVIPFTVAVHLFCAPQVAQMLGCHVVPQ
jgi:hypothetical protein